jgi:hypothetical protein
MATINDYNVKCPMCQCEEFEQVKSNYPLYVDRVSSTFGVQPSGPMHVDVYVCQGCKYVMIFA